MCDGVFSAVEQGCVAVHHACVSDELVSVLVLIALRLVLHVFECDRELNDVLVGRSVLFRHLVVVNTMLVIVPHLL